MSWPRGCRGLTCLPTQEEERFERFSGYALWQWYSDVTAGLPHVHWPLARPIPILWAAKVGSGLLPRWVRARIVIGQAGGRKHLAGVKSSAARLRLDAQAWHPGFTQMRPLVL